VGLNKQDIIDLVKSHKQFKDRIQS